ncbi:MAG TPA: nucleotidyltransferase domain-containing protein [Stellaceae bacterium]|jgi:predicted nucleotidyltransferase|nr:nucleotidyltransferase domain-containing protein [Stellaceae bacterium]
MVLGALGERDAAVWLFGSCARGEARQHSDIDIAILPRDDLPSSFFAELAADFEESRSPTMSTSSTYGGRMRRWSTRCAAKV